MDHLRFKKGSVYSVSAVDMWYHPPINRWKAPLVRTACVEIRFTCDPANAKQLVTESLAVVKEVATAGPSADHIAAVQKIHLNSLTKKSRSNSEVIRRILQTTLAMEFQQSAGPPPEGVLDAAAAWDKLRQIGRDRIQGFTAETCQETIGKFFQPERCCTAILFPADAAIET